MVAEIALASCGAFAVRTVGAENRPSAIALIVLQECAIVPAMVAETADALKLDQVERPVIGEKVESGGVEPVFDVPAAMRVVESGERRGEVPIDLA